MVKYSKRRNPYEVYVEEYMAQSSKFSMKDPMMSEEAFNVNYQITLKSNKYTKKELKKLNSALPQITDLEQRAKTLHKIENYKKGIVTNVSKSFAWKARSLSQKQARAMQKLLKEKGLNYTQAQIREMGKEGFDTDFWNEFSAAMAHGGS